MLFKLIHPGSTDFGLLIPRSPSAHPGLFSQHHLLGLEFNSFRLRKLQLFHHIYPCSPNIGFLILNKELETTLHILVFGSLNVSFKLGTFFSDRLECLILLIIDLIQLVILPFGERVITVDLVVSS